MIQDKHDKSLLKDRWSKKDTLPPGQILEEKFSFGGSFLSPEASDPAHQYPGSLNSVGPTLRGHSPKPFASVQEVKQYRCYSVGVRSFAKIPFQKVFTSLY